MNMCSLHLGTSKCYLISLTQTYDVTQLTVLYMLTVGTAQQGQVQYTKASITNYILKRIYCVPPHNTSYERVL